MKNLSEIKPYGLYNASLVAILIFYGLLGAFVFRKLETKAANTIPNNPQRLISKEVLLKELWNKNDMEFDQWSTFVEDKLDAYINNLEMQPPDTVEWNFADSWLFACTIFTTIGYGNIAPVSTAGRVFCILYALIGIPLFSVIASSLASLFMDFLRLLLSRKKHLQSANQEMTDETQPQAVSDEPTQIHVNLSHVFALNVAYLAFGAVLFSVCEEWTLFESFYYCFVTLTTIGLGDYVPQNIHHTVPFGGYMLIGLVLVIMLFGAIEGEITNQLDKIKQRFVKAEQQLEESKKVD